MKQQRYLRIERKDSDLPFYNGQPMQISFLNWLFILLFNLLGFLYLSTMSLPFIGPLANHFVSVLMLPFLALLGFGIITRQHWKAIFRKLRLNDLWLIPLLTLISLVVSFGLAAIAGVFAPLASNPAATSDAATVSVASFVLTRVFDLFQLFGEEFLAIFPLLALFQLFYQKTKLSRNQSLILALFLSSLLFGTLHLPTYQWNVVQCLVVIGLGRVVDSLSYIITRNIWVSFAVHYLFDNVPAIIEFIANYK